MNYLLSRGLFGGARHHQKVDGRIIASINKNLHVLVKKRESWELDEIDSKLKKIIVSTYERVH